MSEMEVDNTEEKNTASPNSSTGSSNYAVSTGNSDDYMSCGQGNDGCDGQSCGSGQQAHVQSPQQMLPGAQASKQTVYEVFRKCLAILEEMKYIELRGHKPTERSNIDQSDQSKFDITTIREKLNTQLSLLQNQLVSCNEEFEHNVKEDMRKAILQRASGLIPDETTAIYMNKMIEMIETDHTENPNQSPTIVDKDMNKARQGLMQGQHHQADLDKNVKRNPDKEAKGPDHRTSKGSNKEDDQMFSSTVSAGRSNNRSTDFTWQGDQYMLGGSHGHDDRHRQYGPHGPVYGQQAHAQTQEQLLRSVQASKQMVYEVFGNCVTMLEELEHRELKLNGIKPTERSDIYLPDQSKFDDATIQRKLDTQLILLKTQLVSCNEEIKDSVKEEMKRGILHWASGRGEHIPNGITDVYASKIFEMLETGHTEYPKEFDQPPKIGEKDMHKALQGLIQGQHHQAELDKKFKENPDKEAEAPKLRKSKGIDKGADRVAKAKPEMSKSVNNHRESLR